MFDVDCIAFLIETEDIVSDFLCGVINSHTNISEIFYFVIAPNYDNNYW